MVQYAGALPAREAASMLKATYDHRSDVLYLSKGAPVPALSDQDDDGLLLRRAIKTGEPVGVTVFKYSKWISYHQELAEKVAKFLDIPASETKRVLRSIDNEINA